MALRPTRRDQALGAPSAAALLLSILGEFVLPGDGTLWSATAVAALGELGVEEMAARQALSRTARRGWLEAHRYGRRVQWQLTPAGSSLLSQGAERIYGFGSSPVPWDGEWLLVFASVPEERREIRHQLRNRLLWAGFGSFAPSCWIATSAAGRESDARSVLAELDLLGTATFFRGQLGSSTPPAVLANAAWDLESLAARYGTFLALCNEMRAAAPAINAFVAQTRLVHAWRRFPFLDPALPVELLGRDWVGHLAVNAFRALHDQLAPSAQVAWEHLVATTS